MEYFARRFDVIHHGSSDKGLFDNPFMHLEDAQKLKEKDQSEDIVVDEVRELEIEDPQDITEDNENLDEDPGQFTEIDKLRAGFAKLQQTQFSEAGRPLYVAPETFQIEEWDPLGIPPDTSFLISGERRTGKTTLTKYLFYLYRHAFEWAHIFDGSASEGTYQDMFPNSAITEGYDPDIMGELEDMQRNMKRAAKRGLLPENYNPYGLIFMDDVLGRDTHHNEKIEAAYTRGRHLALMVGFLSQRYKGLSPTARLNSDVVILFGTSSWTDKRSFAEEQLGMLNMRTAMELIDMYTQERHALIIEKWRKSPFPEEFIKVFKAPKEVPDFKFGSEDFWEDTVGLDMLQWF